MATQKGKKIWLTRFFNRYKQARREEEKMLYKIFTNVLQIQGVKKDKSIN